MSTWGWVIFAIGLVMLIIGGLWLWWVKSQKDNSLSFANQAGMALIMMIFGIFLFIIGLGLVLYAYSYPVKV